VAGEELGVAEVLERAFEVVFEDVGHGDELDVLGAGEHVDDGLGAAASASDETGFEFLFACAADQVRLDESECGGGAEDSAAGEGRHDGGMISPGEREHKQANDERR
jgi:hypothetical protein